MNMKKVLKILIIVGCLLTISTVAMTGVSAHTTQEDITVAHGNNPTQPPIDVDIDEDGPVADTSP